MNSRQKTQRFFNTSSYANLKSSNRTYYDKSLQNNTMSYSRLNNNAGTSLQTDKYNSSSVSKSKLRDTSQNYPQYRSPAQNSNNKSLSSWSYKAFKLLFHVSTFQSSLFPGSLRMYLQIHKQKVYFTCDDEPQQLNSNVILLNNYLEYDRICLKYYRDTKTYEDKQIKIGIQAAQSNLKSNMIQEYNQFQQYGQTIINLGRALNQHQQSQNKSFQPNFKYTTYEISTSKFKYTALPKLTVKVEFYPAMTVSAASQATRSNNNSINIKSNNPADEIRLITTMNNPNQINQSNRQYKPFSSSMVVNPARAAFDKQVNEYTSGEHQVYRQDRRSNHSKNKTNQNSRVEGICTQRQLNSRRSKKSYAKGYFQNEDGIVSGVYDSLQNSDQELAKNSYQYNNSRRNERNNYESNINETTKLMGRTLRKNSSSKHNKYGDSIDDSQDNENDETSKYGSIQKQLYQDYMKYNKSIDQSSEGLSSYNGQFKIFDENQEKLSQKITQRGGRYNNNLAMNKINGGINSNSLEINTNNANISKNTQLSGKQQFDKNKAYNNSCQKVKDKSVHQNMCQLQKTPNDQINRLYTFDNNISQSSSKRNTSNFSGISNTQIPALNFSANPKIKSNFPSSNEAESNRSVNEKLYNFQKRISVNYIDNTLANNSNSQTKIKIIDNKDLSNQKQSDFSSLLLKSEVKEPQLNINATVKIKNPPMISIKNNQNQQIASNSSNAPSKYVLSSPLAQSSSILQLQSLQQQIQSLQHQLRKQQIQQTYNKTQLNKYQTLYKSSQKQRNRSMMQVQQKIKQQKQKWQNELLSKKQQLLKQEQQSRAQQFKKQQQTVRQNLRRQLQKYYQCKLSIIKQQNESLIQKLAQLRQKIQCYQNENNKLKHQSAIKLNEQLAQQLQKQKHNNIELLEQLKISQFELRCQKQQIIKLDNAFVSLQQSSLKQLSILKQKLLAHQQKQIEKLQAKIQQIKIKSENQINNIFRQNQALILHKEQIQQQVQYLHSTKQTLKQQLRFINKQNQVLSSENELNKTQINKIKQLSLLLQNKNKELLIKNNELISTNQQNHNHINQIEKQLKQLKNIKLEQQTINSKSEQKIKQLYLILTNTRSKYQLAINQFKQQLQKIQEQLIQKDNKINELQQGILQYNQLNNQLLNQKNILKQKLKQFNAYSQYINDNNNNSFNNSNQSNSFNQNSKLVNNHKHNLNQSNLPQISEQFYCQEQCHHYQPNNTRQNANNTNPHYNTLNQQNDNFQDQQKQQHQHIIKILQQKQQIVVQQQKELQQLKYSYKLFKQRIQQLERSLQIKQQQIYNCRYQLQQNNIFYEKVVEVIINEIKFIIQNSEQYEIRTLNNEQTSKRFENIIKMQFDNNLTIIKNSSTHKQVLKSIVNKIGFVLSKLEQNYSQLHKQMKDLQKNLTNKDDQHLTLVNKMSTISFELKKLQVIQSRNNSRMKSNQSKNMLQNMQSQGTFTLNMFKHKTEFFDETGMFVQENSQSEQNDQHYQESIQYIMGDKYSKNTKPHDKLKFDLAKNRQSNFLSHKNLLLSSSKSLSQTKMKLLFSSPTKKHQLIDSQNVNQINKISTKYKTKIHQLRLKIKNQQNLIKNIKQDLQNKQQQSKKLSVQLQKKVEEISKLQQSQTQNYQKNKRLEEKISQHEKYFKEQYQKIINQLRDQNDKLREKLKKQAQKRRQLITQHQQSQQQYFRRSTALVMNSSSNGNKSLIQKGSSNQPSMIISNNPNQSFSSSNGCNNQFYVNINQQLNNSKDNSLIPNNSFVPNNNKQYHQLMQQFQHKLSQSSQNEHKLKFRLDQYKAKCIELQVRLRKYQQFGGNYGNNSKRPGVNVEYRAPRKG